MRRLLLLAVALTACGPAQSGRELYLSYGCAACHGTKGDGQGPGAGLATVKPRDLRRPERFSDRSEEGIAKTIAAGRSTMPAYPDIPKNERLAIARYILSLGEEHP